MNQPDERLAQVGEIELCYEEFGDPDGEPMLLVMGLATQMVGWHEDFCAELVGRGYRVIRFDNRDIGHSSTLDGEPMPPRGQMLLGYGRPAYSLSDLGGDAAGLLDALEIDSAHVVGASMGGMISQVLAIEHPRKVRSLASIMSHPGSRATRMPTLRAMSALMGAPPRDREGFVANTERIFKVIGSPGFEHDWEYLREVAGVSYDRGHSPAGVARQMHAISTSPSRVKALRRVRAPTVVIHGDKDPLVRPIAGRATAKAIPGARLVVVKGMGHDLPRGAWPQIVEAIEENAGRSARGQLEQVRPVGGVA